MGSLEGVLKNLYDGSGSLERADDDNDLKLLLSKIDDGLQTHAEVGNLCAVERCEGYVTTLTEADEDAEQFTMKFALLFRNERAAERASDDYDEVAYFLERVQGIDVADTESKDSFVAGEAIRDFEHGGRGAAISRANWVEDCDRNSPDPAADHGVCSCIYDHLKASLGRVPEYDPRWDMGFAPPDVVRAGRQCY